MLLEIWIGMTFPQVTHRIVEEVQNIVQETGDKNQSTGKAAIEKEVVDQEVNIDEREITKRLENIVIVLNVTTGKGRMIDEKETITEDILVNMVKVTMNMKNMSMTIAKESEITVKELLKTEITENIVKIVNIVMMNITIIGVTIRRSTMTIVKKQITKVMIIMIVDTNMAINNLEIVTPVRSITFTTENIKIITEMMVVERIVLVVMLIVIIAATTATVIPKKITILIAKMKHVIQCHMTVETVVTLKGM